MATLDWHLHARRAEHEQAPPVVAAMPESTATVLHLRPERAPAPTRPDADTPHQQSDLAADLAALTRVLLGVGCTFEPPATAVAPVPLETDETDETGDAGESGVVPDPPVVNAKASAAALLRELSFLDD